MEAYRDQYAKLFNNGKSVVVMAISVDPDTTLASWARDSGFPVLFVSDVGGMIGKAYGVNDGKLDARVLFVIGPDGKITYRANPFRELVGQAYDDLASAVAKTTGTDTHGTND
ncbi:MAG TPA: redoxin domain-containing protein [Gemmatimonadaceae bacterium]|nr:redoxin domain-containing protein [Gemmatimonadaceae bacterium]